MGATQLELIGEVTQRITSISDLDELLHQVTHLIRETLGCYYTGILLVEADSDELILRVVSRPFETLVGRLRLKIGQEGITGWAAHSGESLLVNDVSREPRYYFMEELKGTRSELAVPIKLKGEIGGVLDVQSVELDAFSADDVSLLQVLAGQLAIAIENSQLYQMERKRIAQLALVNQVARRAASILDLDQLLEEVVTAIQQGFNYHHVGLFLLDEAAGELQMQAIAGGFADMAPPDHRLALGEGIAGWVAQTGKTLLANDVSQEPCYVLGLLKEALTKAELCVPLKLADQVIGVLDIRSTQLSAFDETDLLAMETLTDQIVVAIENARLFRETSRRFEETMALYQTSLDITAQLARPELLKSIVERAVTLLEAGGGGIYLYDPEQEELRLTVSYAHAEKYVGVTLKPGEGMAGKVFQTGEPLIVDDYRTWEGSAPVYEADQPFTAVLEVPLKWRDRIIGVLAIDADMKKRAFNQDDLWLATLFANQAAVAIENAHIYEEERRRVTQLELISGITQKMASILDLDELLPQVVHLIRDTFSYYRTTVLLVETDSDELVLRAVSSPFETQISRSRLKIGREGITSWVAHSGEPLLVNDVSREPRYYSLEEAKDTRSELAVPIKLKEEIIGVLDVQSVELEAFRQDDVSTLQTLADQLAIAIENARLYEAERQQLHRLEGLAVASQQITAELDPASVLEKIVTQALTTLEADRAAVFLLDWEKDRLFCAHSRGLSAEYVDGVNRHYREMPDSQHFVSSEPIHVLDAQTDPTTEVTWQAILRERYHTLAVLPLVCKGKVIGALAVYRDTIRAFRPEELALAQSFANQAAVAIENARLYQQTDEKLQARVREQVAFYAIAEVVNRSELDQVLQLALDSAIRLTGMDSGGVWLLDRSTHELFLRARRGWSPKFIRAVSHTKADEGFMPHMLQSLLVVDDLSKLTKERRVAIEREGLQSVVSIPLKAGENALGVMGLTSHSPGIFSSQEFDLLTTIGNQVGVVVDRANLRAQELRVTILEAELRDRQSKAETLAAIGDMMGIMAHRMNNILGAARANLLNIARKRTRGELASEFVEDSLQQVMESIDKALGMLKTLSRPFRSDIELEEVDVNLCLSSAMERLTPPRGIQVIKDYTRGLPAVVATREYLIEVFSNLITNAIEAMGDTGRLDLHSQLVNNWIEVSVTDTGPGISEELQEKIFELGSSFKKTGEGLGFGLWWSRTFLERLGGSLHVESQVGAGSKFVVRLPAGAKCESE